MGRLDSSRKQSYYRKPRFQSDEISNGEISLVLVLEFSGRFMRGRRGWGGERGAHKERHQNGKCISRQTRLPTSRCNQTPSGEWCKCNWKHPWCILWSMPRAPFFSFFRRNVARHPSVPVIKSRFPVISAPPPSAFYLLYTRAPVSSAAFSMLFSMRLCYAFVETRNSLHFVYTRTLFNQR